MFHSKGFDFMGRAISDTAEYGGLTRGSLLINDNVIQDMKSILKDIQNKSFHNEWIKASEKNSSSFTKLRLDNANLDIDKVTKEILDNNE